MIRAKAPAPTAKAERQASVAPRQAPAESTGARWSLRNIPATDPLATAKAGLEARATPLPHLDRIQSAFGKQHDLSSVTAHVGGPAARANEQLDARAYALGDRVAFASSPDLRLAAHEAAHVVQQRQGVTAAHGRDSSYERRADEVADAVGAGHSAETLLGPARNGAPTTSVVQFDTKPVSTTGVAHLAPTSMLLEMAKTRLQAIEGDGYANIAIHEVITAVDDRLEGRIKESPDILRERALRLNAFLVANGTLFAAFPPLEQPADYPAGVAADAVELVTDVSRAYAVTLQLAFNEDAKHAIYDLALERASAKMTPLPDQLTKLYLSPAGFAKDIKRVDKELRELQEMRNFTSKAPLRGRPAETMMELDAPKAKQRVAAEIEHYLDQTRLGYAHGQNVGGAIQDMSLFIRQALGVTYAMQVYEQLDLYATARDSAVNARGEDELAASGLDKLERIFKTNKPRVDEILANVAPGQMLDFLRALGDSAAAQAKVQSARAGFATRLAGSMKLIGFARRFGLGLVINLDRRFDLAKLETVLDKVEALFKADPDAVDSLRDALADAKSAEAIEKLLGEEAAKKPKRPPVRAKKSSLPVDRSTEKWAQRRAEIKGDFEARGWTRKPEQIDQWTDCKVFFEDAKRGDYNGFGRRSKMKFLDAFDALAEAADVPSQWLSSNRGNLAEVFFNPGYGNEKPRFVRAKDAPYGRKVTGAKVRGETVPDYHIDHPGFTEYVNQKSDLIDRETKSAPKRDGVFTSGLDAARNYLRKALVNNDPKLGPDDGKFGEALSLPEGARYSLDFIRDPGVATAARMLDILFDKASPIYRVKFGDGPWHTNPRMK